MEGLVRAASSSALKRYMKVGDTVSVDPEAIEKIQVTRQDFLYSLENDVKPALGTNEEILDQYIKKGIINWGDTRDVIERGMVFVKQVRGLFRLYSSSEINDSLISGKTFRHEWFILSASRRSPQCRDVSPCCPTG